MSGTPISITVSSKKRELSSPEGLLDFKKNRISGFQSESEGDISDLSVIESMEKTGATGGEVGEVGETSTHSTQITLSDTHLQKMVSLMQASFQPQMSQIIEESFYAQVSDLVNSIVQGVLQGLHNKIDSLEAENVNLKQRVLKLETALDNVEQYSRRNCLKISGVPESTEGTTDDIVCNIARAIDVDLNINDIDRSHRLGKSPSSVEGRERPRDIIVKFMSYRVRAKFYKARVQTKSRGYKGVFINEHLTKARSKLLYEARRRVKSKQLKNAWSNDGAVMIKLNDANPERNFDGTVMKINSESDLPAYVPLSNS